MKFDARKLPNIAEELALIGEGYLADRLMEIVSEPDYQALVHESIADGGFQLACLTAWRAIDGRWS